MKTKKELYHFYTKCENVVAKKINEPFKFPYECKHDKKYWKRIYLINEEKD